ncbi:hypothetical protein JCM10450v2_003152 [Rhodotorula kratochvilovae]
MHALRAGLRRAPLAVPHRLAIHSTRAFSLAPIASLAASHTPSYTASAPSAEPSLVDKLRQSRAERSDAAAGTTRSPPPSSNENGAEEPAPHASGSRALHPDGSFAARVDSSRVADFGVAALRIPGQEHVQREEAKEGRKEVKRQNRRKKTARKKELIQQRLAEKERAVEQKQTAKEEHAPAKQRPAMEEGRAGKARKSGEVGALEGDIAALREISNLKQRLRKLQNVMKPWDELAPMQRKRQADNFHRPVDSTRPAPSDGDVSGFAAALGLSSDGPPAPGSFDAIVQASESSGTEDVAPHERAAKQAQLEEDCGKQWPARLHWFGVREQLYERQLATARRELDELRALPVPSRRSLPQREAPPLMEQLAETLPLPRKGARRAGAEREAEVPRDPAPHLVQAPHREARNEREGYYSNHPALRDAPPPEEDSPPPRPLSSYQHVLSPSSIPYEPRPSPIGDVPIATLAHSLDRVLFNPGVHFLRDPRTGVYNFTREVLENVPRVDEFDFGKLPQYVTSSKDEVLRGLMETEGRMFAGSTSSTIGMLCQIYFWLSMGKPINTDMLSGDFRQAPKDFSMGQQLPASVVLRLTDGRYSIDADKSFDAGIETNILAHYGHLMEKLLTTEAGEFKRFLHDSEDPAPSEADHRQAYHYGMTEHMVLRSQLDAQNPYLPNKTFDLKTRGTVAIRQDRLNYEESAGYLIDKLRGPWESFEREYYDLIRSAFLKYQFQARIGNMDGIFVAYHSTARFYGFQYVPISEMDDALFGNAATGDAVFHLALGTLETVLKRAAACFPGESVNVTFASDKDQDVLRVFVARQSDLEAVEQGGATSVAEGEDPPPPRSDDLGIPMTLLELRGTSYLDGVAQDAPVTLPSLPEHTLATPNAEDLLHPSARRTWQLAFDIVSSSTTSNPGEDPVPPHEVARLFARTRGHQRMFSSLYLPTGISPAEVREAQERAQEAGVELDESDLALRFPFSEGLEYTSPSRGVKALRRRARQGEERRKVEDEKRRGERVVEVVSRVVEREELFE